MKIKHLTSYLNYNSSPHNLRKKSKTEQGVDSVRERAFAGKNKQEINNRPAKSVNFGGSLDLKPDDFQKIINKALSELIEEGGKDFKGIKDAPEWAVKFLKSERINGALRLVKENEALFENLITIVLAGLLKPLCVIAMPGAEMEDKQMSATKNFVGAVTGFILSSIILTPVSKGVRKVTGNLSKYITDTDYIKLINSGEFGDELVKTTKKGKKLMSGDLADAYSTFYKKVADLAVTPTKAAITIAFTPVVLDMLFGKKKAQKKAQEQEAAKQVQPEVQPAIQQGMQNIPIQLNLKDNEQVFSQFLGGAAK